MADTNKILTIFLVVIVCIAAVVLLYVNLPKDGTTDDNSDENTNGNADNNETEEPLTVLTVIYGEEQINYTMDEIKAMPSYTGIGGKIKKTGSTTGPYNYTGVKMSTLLAEFEELSANYSINTKSSDGYPQDYSYNEIQGTVELFNETRVPLGNVSLTMIIAYMEVGEDITDPEYGPLMIVFVDDYYTDSSLWAKMLATIEIIEE
jgi:hypothetical protein